MAETNSEDFSQVKHHRGYFQIWAATVPMVAICAMTIVANGAILTMFLSRRGLRRIKNLYFASLALADFLVGLTMPYKLTKDLHQTWNSDWGCRVYQNTKQALSYVSFLSIFLITLDKWRATNYPVSYRMRNTKRMAITAVVFAWIISFIIFTAPQIWWDNFIFSRSTDSERGTKITPAGNGVNMTPEETVHVSKGRNVDPSKNQTRTVRYRIGGSADIYEYGICPEGYHLTFNLSVVSTTLLYIIPIAIMFIFDITLYLKIKWRKSVEVQRSTSVTDTYFMTLKKPTMELPESCVTATADDDPAKESLLKNSEKPINKHLALGNRGERRHSSLPAISPIIKGRTSSGRRVSMPESNTGSGGCRYVGRKWSGCATAFGNNQNQPPNPMANLAPRMHNEDMVHDILVKQDKKTARCLCLMLAVLTTSWLPHAVASMINAKCWCLHGTVITATSWFFLVDHALNPFLYGLMNVQFKNVLKQWLLIERVHAFKMRDTLILKNLQKKVMCEDNNRERSPNPHTKHNQFEVPQMTTQIEIDNIDADNTPL